MQKLEVVFVSFAMAVFRDLARLPREAPIFTFLPLIYPVSSIFQAEIKFFFDFFSIFFVFAPFLSPFRPFLRLKTRKKHFPADVPRQEKMWKKSLCPAHMRG